VGVARYARADYSQTGGQEDGENFEPQDPQEATILADLETGYNPAKKKYTRQEAVKFIMQRRQQNQRNGVVYDYGHDQRY
jgi:hypothetical protein